MKRFALTVLLKDDPQIIQQYEAYHTNPWPEVLAGMERAGIRQVLIYRFHRQLFMLMETVDDFDLERDMPKYMEHPRAREWDTRMRTLQEPVAGAPDGATWALMSEVFAYEVSH